MPKQPEKTNVMRVLDQHQIPYTAHTYDPDAGLDGMSVAGQLGQDPAAVFKTLVARGASGGYYVFDIPVVNFTKNIASFYKFLETIRILILI